MRALVRRAGLVAGIVLLAPPALVLALNLFLNAALPALLSRQPERLDIGWAWAWTWDARQVSVAGFHLRGQGPGDQWWVAVDRATLVVELRPLLSRRFQADAIRAEGVALRYRRRVDAPPGPDGAAAVQTDGVTAPIPGLENPPLAPPEELYPPPATPWLVALDDLAIEDLREIWLGDYRFDGTASAEGEIIVMPGQSVDLLGARMEVYGGAIEQDGVPVLSDLDVQLEGALVGADPALEPGIDMFRHLDATADLTARVDDLRAVDLFLADAPWVGISGGTGTLRATLDVRGGMLAPGSTAEARVTGLDARVGTYAASGDGTVRLRVAERAHLGVVLSPFAIYPAGSGEALVRGAGFRLDAETDRVGLVTPPRGFAAVATLPPSEVPRLGALDQFLPADIGLRILGGRATVAGRARIAEDGDRVSGALTVSAPEVRVRYGSLPVTGALRVDGRVVDGSLDRGTYDVRGSSFVVHDVALGDGPAAWWARLDVREGRVAAGAATFLTVDAVAACADSGPFFRVAVGDRKIPPWVEDLVRIRDLRGELRASFGQRRLSLDHLLVQAPKAEVHLHLAQDEARLDALLFARLGALGLATRVAGDAYEVQAIDARRWFHARLADAGTPERMVSNRGVVTEAGETRADTRRGLRILGEDMRRLFEKKPRPSKDARPSGAPAEGPHRADEGARR